LLPEMKFFLLFIEFCRADTVSRRNFYPPDGTPIPPDHSARVPDEAKIPSEDFFGLQTKSTPLQTAPRPFQTNPDDLPKDFLASRREKQASKRLEDPSKRKKQASKRLNHGLFSFFDIKRTLTAQTIHPEPIRGIATLLILNCPPPFGLSFPTRSGIQPPRSHPRAAWEICVNLFQIHYPFRNILIADFCANEINATANRRFRLPVEFIIARI